MNSTTAAITSSTEPVGDFLALETENVEARQPYGALCVCDRFGRKGAGAI